MDHRVPDNAGELQAWIHDATVDLVRRARRRLSEEYTDHYFETYDAMRSQNRSEDDSHRAAMDALGNAHTLHLASLNLHGDPLRIRFKLATALFGIVLIGAAWYLSNSWYPTDVHTGESVHDAVASGKLDRVIEAVRKTDTLESVNDWGYTPVWRAVSTRNNYQSKESRINVTLYLLEQGADWKRPDPYGKSFLYRAARSSLDPVVDWLLEHGEPLSPEVAIVLGRTEGLEEQLKREPGLANKIVLPTSGDTLLHLAAMRHDSESIRILLAHGANPNARDLHGATALHEALSWAPQDMQKAMTNIDLLIDSGADLTATDSSGRQTIAYAMYSRDIEILEHLVERGADIRFAVDGARPLTLEVHTVEQLDFLMAHGARIDAQDNEGNTALHAIAPDYEYRFELIVAMLGYGADPNIRNRRGRTPLHTLTQDLFGAREIPLIGDPFDGAVRLFLEHGADTSLQDDIGETAYSLTIPLRRIEKNELLAQHPTTPIEAILLGDLDTLTQHLETASQDQKNHWLNYAVASSCGELTMIRVLLENGADPNDYDPERYRNAGRPFYNYQTPLYFAVDKRNLELAKLLLDHSADPNQRVDEEYEYETPIHLATIGGRFEFAKLLLAHGADVHTKDSQGRTPLDLANERRSVLIGDLFRDHSRK